MRAVFINSCHPDTPHVCGLRARAFAEALAAMGHEIILVTEPFEQTGEFTGLDTLPDLFKEHDWTLPCRISTPFISGSSLPAIRDGRYPAILRQPLIALHFLRHGGVFEDWCRGTRPYLPVIAKEFAPDIIWAVFGHTGCWRMGQELARIADCPWVADKKDPWAAFIPAPFRRLIADRFRDAAHLTAISSAHVDMMRRWNADIPATTIYSGVSKSFLSPPPENATTEPATRSILLCGSIYDSEALQAVYQSLAQWLDRQPDALADKISVAYAGADTDLFYAATDPLKGRCAIDGYGQLPLAELHARQRQAAVNLHLHYAPVLFHHKIVELFAAERPVLCYPGESDEAAAIAEKVGAPLYRCQSGADLDEAFERTLGPGAENGGTLNREALAFYSWEEQAVRLQAVFEDVRAG